MMLSPTLQEGLRSCEIGSKVRSWRIKSQMGLIQLARHTGLAPSLLSKIERNQLFPPLPTLYRIALVFGVGLEFCFIGAREKPLVALVRKDQCARLPDRVGAQEPAFRFESLDYPATERKFDSYLAEFRPVAVSKLQPRDHAGAKLVFVLQGQLTMRLDLVDYTLDAGDSLYFDPERAPQLQVHGRADVRGNCGHCVVGSMDCPASEGTNGRLERARRVRWEGSRSWPSSS